MVTAERNYKDTLFRTLFKEKKELLTLYNAINGTNYENPEDLEINTLENVVWMNLKNDVSFIFAFQMHLYEHQSTYNPNMPLRDLFYIARLYEKMMKDQTLYSSTIVKIPTPRFMVFYNGTREQPERQILKLSDAFQIPVERPELELEVTMLNINLGYNKELMEQCKTLKDYMLYVEKVREYAKKMELNQAVEKAVEESIAEGILQEFLTRKKTEVIQMSIFEYDEEKEIEKIRKAEHEIGYEQGRREGHMEGHIEGQIEGRKAANIAVIRQNIEKDISIIAEILNLEDLYVEQVADLITDNPERTDEQILELLNNNKI